MGVSEDLSLAATSFVSFVVYVLLLDLTSQRLALSTSQRQPLHALHALNRAGSRTTFSFLRDRRTTGSENAGQQHIGT